MARLMWLSDAELTLELVHRRVLRQGEPLASRFTDPHINVFARNGWQVQDEIEELRKEFKKICAYSEFTHRSANV